MDPAEELFALGDWQVDASGNCLRRDGVVRPLRHKAMALLVLLARHPGETVSREQIIQAIWDGNQFVAPKAINTAVWAIRQALGDDPEQPRYLATVAKKGYRLIAPVQALPRRAALASAGPGLPGVDRPAPTVPPLPAQPVSAVQGALPPGVAAQPPSPRAAGWKGVWGGGLAWSGLAMALVLVMGTMLAAWAWLRPRQPAAWPGSLRVTPLTQNPGHEYLGRLSPDTRWLAVAWWQGKGAGALYLRPADALTAPMQPLSEPDDEVTSVAWSPDGQSLAYTALSAQGRCTLWRQPVAEGRRQGQRQALARCAPVFTPAMDWSPDGRWLVFSGEDAGAGGLFLVAPDGSGQRRLTTAPPAAMADHQPAWSPDSRRVAFVRQDPADSSRDLFEIGLEGRPQRLSEWRLQGIHGLSFLPGGQDLVLSVTQQDGRVLMRWQRAGGQARPLGLEGSAPTVAADGRLVYALLRSHVSIARLSAPGGPPQRVMHSVASDRMPDQHPRAGMVFVSRRSGHPELWLAPPGGEPPRALTQLQGQVASPAWSPRADAVAFLGSCGPGGRVGLCLLTHPGGILRPLAADAAAYGRPAWHPSRNEVWVTSNRGGRWQLWKFDATGAVPAASLHTEHAPGRAVQWAPDGSGFVYQSRQQPSLRWQSEGGGAERELGQLPAGEDLLDWHWGHQGLTLLTRGDQERFLRWSDGANRLDLLGVHPLGSFPELATFTQAADGSLWVELADVAVADLMQAR